MSCARCESNEGVYVHICVDCQEKHDALVAENRHLKSVIAQYRNRDKPCDASLWDWLWFMVKLPFLVAGEKGKR